MITKEIIRNNELTGILSLQLSIFLIILRGIIRNN